MIATWLTHVFFLALSSGVHDDNKSTMMKSSSPMLVVFGKPGAGKTTVANAALSKLETMRKIGSSTTSTTTTEEINAASAAVDLVMKNLNCVGLDLDVCVPQWMKDNFSNGIYPTLEERQEFALNACDYVDQQLQEQEKRSRQQRLQQLQRNDEVMDNNDKKKKETTPTTTTIGGGDCSSTKLSSSSSSSSLSSSIISFSFVNTDLRDTFRSRFPTAIWVLIDTDDEEATKRINLRQDHFYKGKDPSVDASSDDDNTSQQQTAKEKEEEELPKSSSVSAADKDNSEWLFAPVTFPHHVLPGQNSVDENADTVLQILFDQFN